MVTLTIAGLVLLTLVLVLAFCCAANFCLSSVFNYLLFGQCLEVIMKGIGFCLMAIVETIGEATK